MKRSRSLKAQILILLSMLVVLQSTALAFTLRFSQVFQALDAESFRVFGTASEARASAVDRGIGELVGGVSAEAERLSSQIQAFCLRSEADPAQIHLDDALYEQTVAEAVQSVINLLGASSVTGAFVVLEGSNIAKDNALRHGGVYIRNTAPDSPISDNRSLQLEMGPDFITTEYRIAMSVGWSPDLHFSESMADDSYYRRPLKAVAEHPRSELLRYGYWSAGVQPLGERQEAVCYTLPLLDREGEAFGVMGLELSLFHLSRRYLPNTDLPFPNSFYAVVQGDGETVGLDWFIPSGPVAQLYLNEEDQLILRPSRSGMYLTEVEGLGEMYCSPHRLRIYSDNSPFYGESWSLIAFVGARELHETSARVRVMLVGSIAVTTALSFVAVLFLSWFTTKEIARLPATIRSFAPNREISFQKTGLREIDELTAAVEVLNHNVINASRVTSKIMELTSMPMGGFELARDGEYVVLTGFLQELLGVAPDEPVTAERWRAFYDMVVASPDPAYPDIYAYTTPGGDTLWLRVRCEETEDGMVGTVLDVTVDVERSRTLANELDYDALTHLYSRAAFKRKVHDLLSRGAVGIGAMVFADLDNLKFINDTFGHDVGDRFLTRAGRMFARFSELGGIVSRISGDEFAVFLYGYGSAEEVLEQIDRLLEEFREVTMTTPDGQRQRVRFSAGVALYPEDSDNATDLLKLSDFAMYEAKHTSKGTLLRFDRRSYRQNAYLLDKSEAINRLIDESLIRFALQPIVCLHTGEVYGYEALMRPLLDNFSSPLEILSVASAQSKLGQLERMVVMNAFQFFSEHQRVLEGKRLFVNSVPSQQPELEDLQFIARRYSQATPHITVEITEEVGGSLEQLQRKVEVIKGLGMQLAIDDFGEGHSNELRILSLHPDVIKIDMGVIRDIHQSRDKQRMVKNILGFCAPKGIKVIAEGVETREELAELHRLGVDYAQGYFLGRPSFDAEQLSDEVVGFIRALEAGGGSKTRM